jgi:hypothetical protein
MYSYSLGKQASHINQFPTLFIIDMKSYKIQHITNTDKKKALI